MIQSVDRALRLLAEVRDQPGSSLTELSDRLDLLPSTASRLLATLEMHGLLERERTTKAYQLGPGARALGRAAEGEPDPLQLLDPIVRELALTVGEQASVAVLDGRQVVHTFTIDGARATGREIVLSTTQGQRDSNLNVTALGKIFLAYVSKSRADVIIEGLHMNKTAPRTITDRGELRRHLERVRRNRYAFSIDENTESVRGVAAPIFRADGTLAYGLAVHGPTIRLSRGRLRELVPLVCDAAKACSTALESTRISKEPAGRPE